MKLVLLQLYQTKVLRFWFELGNRCFSLLWDTCAFDLDVLHPNINLVCSS